MSALSDAIATARRDLDRADAWPRPAFPTEASEHLDMVSTSLQKLLAALSTPPADDVREALAMAWDEGHTAYREGDYDHVLQTYVEGEANPYRDASHVRPYGTVTEAPSRPTHQDGGVWGSYVAYLAELEAWVGRRGMVADAEVADVPGFEGTREMLRSLGVQSDSENARLRQALNDLNEDLEEFLSRAHQEGHEDAKSWMIRAQRRTITSLRARLRESEARS